MKTIKSILLGAAATGAIASSAHAQIASSAHNFSSNLWSQNQICLPCHTPHHAIDGMPRLWNHELTTATYQMHGVSYSGVGGAGTGVTIGAPFTAETNFDSVSRMCLSCHDGTVALDSFGGTTGSTTLASSDPANLGTDLEDDHPVGSDGIYFNSTDPNRPSWWTGAFVAPTGSTFSTVGALSLKSWTSAGGTAYKVVGCTTCHNPHNRYGGQHMLGMAGSNLGSTLCLNCHIK